MLQKFERFPFQIFIQTFILCQICRARIRNLLEKCKIVLQVDQKITKNQQLSKNMQKESESDGCRNRLQTTFAGVGRATTSSAVAESMNPAANHQNE